MSKDKNEKQETALVKFENFALAKIQAEKIKELFAANLGDDVVTQFDLQRVKVPAGGALSWETTDPDSGEPQSVRELEGIIVFSKYTRAYWTTKGTNSPPDCKSDDGKAGVGNPGGVCATCPFAQFGTALKDGGVKGRGQACQLKRLIFLLQKENIIPIVVVAPVMSLKAYKQFSLAMTQMERFLNHSIIGLSLANDRNADGIKYSKIAFQFISEISKEQATIVDAYAKTMCAGWESVGVDVGDYNTEEDVPDFPPKAKD